MWKDPIVEETRELRDEYARQLNYDVDAIFEDITRSQRESGKKFVSFPSRKPPKIQAPPNKALQPTS